MATERDNLLNEAVLYLCAFAVSATGVWAVSIALEDEVMARTFTLALMAGFGVSWLLRRSASLQPYSLVWTAGLGLMVMLYYRATGTMLGVPVIPLLGQAERQGAVALLLAGLVIVRSYGLLRTEDLLFCVVPSLALFGVAGSMVVSAEVTVLFVAFVFAAAYLAGQAHLAEERSRSRTAPGPPARGVARTRLGVVAVMLAAAVLAAMPTARAARVWIPHFDPPTGPVAEPESAEEEERLDAGAGARPVWVSPETMAVGAGPVRLGEGIVMRVRAEQPLYWRAGSLPRYTGERWFAAQEPPTGIAPGADESFDLRPVVNAPSGRVVRQEFGLAEIAGDLLFAGMQPLEVRLPPGAAVRHGVTVDAAGSLRLATRGWGRPTTVYEVLSQVDRLAPADSPSVLAADDPELLRVPNSARQVAAYARQAVGSITVPAAQVEAIADFLQTHAGYSLDAPATPAGRDAVIYFLSESRVGYCDLFASAAALMCRALGIPARVAVGYLPGDYDPAAGEYVVRERHAHAWVEAYLGDKGWVLVDATPGGEPQAAGPLARRAWLAGAWAWVRRSAPYLVVGLALLTWALLTAKARWLDEYLALRRRERSLSPQDYRGWVILHYEKFARALARRGLERRETETPGEYALRLGKGAFMEPLMAGVRAITSDYLVARFSQRRISAEQAQRAGEVVEHTTRTLRRLHTLR